MGWLKHPGVPLTPRMEAEIRGRRRRLVDSRPDVTAVGVTVAEQRERPGGRHVYCIEISFSFRGKKGVVKGRPEARATLAIAQAFRAAQRKIEDLHTGRKSMTTRRRLKVEDGLDTSRRGVSKRRKRRLSAGTTPFTPPIFFIGR